MKQINKFLIILINIFLLTTLSACNSTTITDNGTVDATTNISWSGDKKEIVVSTVTIKCNDNYYGVVVNDSINFNNDNNYFTTGNGLLIQITDNEDSLVSNNSTYSYKATIEDDVSLYVSGNDEEKIKEVFNGVYKTNKESYQMFSHDISNDWVNNVVITSDVVSFSNGSDTTYIYQNEGSLSPGSFEGKVEPTVFKKQLRGIDIPITYPEDTDGVSNYIPYGTETYEHWTNEGYTPYSAYTTLSFTKEEYELVTGKKTTRVLNDADEMTNFIILANNDDNVLNLFEEKNDHTQNLYSLSSSTSNVNSTLEVKDENLSSIKDIATSAINSDNRYHFGILPKTVSYLTQWTQSNTNGYFVDGNTYTTDKIAGGMAGKFVSPTMKISSPIYSSPRGTDESISTYSNLKEYGSKYTDVNGEKSVIDYNYAMTASEYVENELGLNEMLFTSHGASYSYIVYLRSEINGLLHGAEFANHYYILEGDYIYYLSANGTLKIFENVATELFIDLTMADRNTELFSSEDFLTNTLLNELTKYTETGSCFFDGNDNLHQLYKQVSIVDSY